MGGSSAITGVSGSMFETQNQYCSKFGTQDQNCSLKIKNEIRLFFSNHETNQQNSCYSVSLKVETRLIPKFLIWSTSHCAFSICLFQRLNVCSNLLIRKMIENVVYIDLTCVFGSYHAPCVSLLSPIGEIGTLNWHRLGTFSW